jgi:hypothetical protein
MALTEESHPDKLLAVRNMFRDLVERSRALREDLIRENDALKARVQALETDLSAAENFLSTEYEKSRKDSERLRRQTTELESENRDFAQRMAELEDRSDSLANLYAVTFQLHSTLDPTEVLRCIVEILVNIVGAAEFGIYLADDSRGEFVLAAREGDAPGAETRFSAPRNAVESAAIQERRTVFREDLASAERGSPAPLASAPLYYGDRLVGFFSIYSLLSQKKSFSDLDREILDLLTGQAALAIVSSQAFVSVDRKLKTVQKFMELLKS